MLRRKKEHTMITNKFSSNRNLFLLFLIFFLLLKNFLLAQTQHIPYVLSIILPKDYRESEVFFVEAIITDDLGLNNIEKVELHFKNSKGYRGVWNMEFNNTINHEANVYKYIGRIPSSSVTEGTLKFYIRTFNRLGEDEVTQEIQIYIPVRRIREEIVERPTYSNEKVIKDSTISIWFNVALITGASGLGGFFYSYDEDIDDEKRREYRTWGIILLAATGVFLALGYADSFRSSKTNRFSINIGYDRIYQKNCYSIRLHYKF